MNDLRFKLEPEQFLPEVTVKHYYVSSKKFRCKMMQIPANSNDATTGHKLQGMSKDAIIVSSWPTGNLAAMFKNWEYVVLSPHTIRTLPGETNRHGQVIPAFSPTSFIHGQDKKI